MRHTNLKDYEKSLSGGEPSWKNGETSLTQALNWYRYHLEEKDSKKFTLLYLKESEYDKKDIETLEKVTEECFQNLGFVCRIKMRGAPLTEKNEMWISSFIDRLKKMNTNAVVAVDNNKPTVSIQERLENKTKEFIGEIEGAIDDCIFVRDFTLITPYEFMRDLGVKGAHTPHIIKFYTKIIKEIEEVIKGKDALLNEGYSHFKKGELLSYAKFLNCIITDCGRLSHNDKLARKPRAKKVKPVDKIVEKLQFKPADKEFNLVSVKPTDIIGCYTLYTFNTKTRKLGIYVCEDSAGLNIKGTTITNYDIAKSVQKTIRKPKEVLTKVIDGGKIVLKKLFSEINAVEQPLTGRINSDIILLRIIR